MSCCKKTPQQVPGGRTGEQPLQSPYRDPTPRASRGPRGPPPRSLRSPPRLTPSSSHAVEKNREASRVHTDGPPVLSWTRTWNTNQVEGETIRPKRNPGADVGGSRTPQAADNSSLSPTHPRLCSGTFCLSPGTAAVRQEPGARSSNPRPLQDRPRRPPPHSGVPHGTLDFFLINTDYTVATFYFGLDSLSETPVFTFFLEGVGREIPDRHPQIRLPAIFPHLCPLGTPPESPPSKLTQPLPSSQPSRSISERVGTPELAHPHPQARQGHRPKAVPVGLVAIPKQPFPKQCLTCLLVWLWGSPPLFPRAPPPQASGKRRRDPTGVRALGEEGSRYRPPHSPPFTPPGYKGTHWKGTGGCVPAPSGQEPPVHSPNASTPHPSILGPSQASKTKVPSDPGVLASAPSLLPPTPRTPHGGKTTESLRDRAQHRGDREEGERPT
ncbi:proline-rich protein 36-like [Herpailurus yagouaroundi]|uniref:proline-rich protein 36-like n=1 Tax=Herpailurus yagouaroundi TaxID=1608482 RepID=UPI001AD60AED|nr:proline-rich protein 36-like [Puma yagouaroundi]